MKYFLDNASTTRCSDEVLEEITKYSKEYFYNPGALYAEGFATKRILEDKRDELISLAGANGFGAVFCASATEADNMALRLARKNTKMLIGAGEHPAIYEVALYMKQQGVDVQFIPLNDAGEVDFDKFKELMTKDVSLVSVMHVSNETGAINPIKKMVEYAKLVNPQVIFHVDGVQAFMKEKFVISALGVDLYTISSHKVHGPKGVGVLFYKKGLKLKPLIWGGGQESGIRSGTESLSLIAGLVCAVNLLKPFVEKNWSIVNSYKHELLSELRKLNVNFIVNGNEEKNSPYILSISVLDVRGEVLLHMLEEYGVLVSTGSACSTKKIGNRILENMNRTQKEIEGNIRISFDASEQFDAKYVANAICECVKKYKRLN